MASQCEIAEQLYNSIQMHALQWVQELIISFYIYCTILAALFGTVQIFHLISRYTASVPCDAQIPKKLCVFRMIVTASIPGFCFVHIGISTQRLQSTFNVRYRLQMITARFFIFASVVYSSAYGYIAFYKEPLQAFVPICTTFSNVTGEVLNINLNLMVISATASAAATFVLWWFNNSRLKQERKEYKIKKTFHRKQCIYSIKQFLPVTIIHTITFVTQFVVFRYNSSIRHLLTPTEFQFLISALNLMPYYCLLAPLTLLILIRRGRFERSAAVRSHITPAKKEVNTDIYFRQLNTSWSPVPQNLHKNTQEFTLSMAAECELAEQLYNCTQLHALQWVHLTCSFSSIILCAYTAQKYVHKSLFESATKELIIALYVFCTLHAASIGTAQIFHLTSRYTASVPCDAQIPKKLCILRMIVTSSVSGFCFIHVGITTQRLQSAFNVRSRIQRITSRIFILASVVYSCAFGYITFHKVPLDGLSPYCTSFTNVTEVVMMRNLDAMVTSGVLSALATLGLWWFNNDMLKKERKEYQLKKTFHRKLCIYSIKQFLPVTIIHTITFIIQFIIYRYSIPLRLIVSPAEFVFINSAINVMPYYCLLAPLTLLILIRRGRFERNAALRGHIAPERREANTHIYFSQLSSSWSPVPQNVSKYTKYAPGR